MKIPDNVEITLPRRDVLRAIGILESRASYLERRREADTNIHAFHQTEAKHSRRLAAAIRDALPE